MDTIRGGRTNGVLHPMNRMLFLLAAGVLTLVVSLVGATLIAPLFGEDVPVSRILEETVSRTRVSRRGMPIRGITIPQATRTERSQANAPRLPIVARPNDLQESPASIDSGMRVLSQLRGTIPQLEDVYEVLETSKATIAVRNLGDGLGQFLAASQLITIDAKVMRESNFVVAMVLAHEGQHALDYRKGQLGSDQRSCYNAEARAFDLSIFVWQALWGMDGKTTNVSRIEADFNRMAAIRHNDQLGYVVRLLDLYGDRCS